MKLKIKSTILVFLVFAGLAGNAQQQFTLRNAIDTALSNNFDIRIARNNVEISSINNSYGIAGGLPNISASAGDNISLNNTSQKLSNGTESGITNQGENTLGAGISAGITLFNGFRITATKERLNRIQNQDEIQLNQQIQSTISGIMITYFDIIRQQNYLKIIQNSLDVSKQKLEIVNAKNSVGMVDKVEILQAQTDVNSAEQLLEIQKLVIEQTKSDLLLLINAKKRSEFSVTDSIVVDATLQLDSILSYLNRNPQYLSAEQQILIEEQLVKEVAAQRYPSVKLNAGYDYYQSDLNKGTISRNQNYGPTAGLSLQIPIFNGNIYKTQSDIAKIRVDNSKLEKENMLSSLTTLAIKTYRSYSTTLQQIESQRENFEMTKQLVEIVMQQYHVSQATILEVKAAQTSFENAAFLLVNLQYSAKVSEIQLKQLIYRLSY